MKLSPIRTIGLCLGLGLSLSLATCSPIIIDRMPCAGDVYFDLTAEKHFRLWGKPSLQVTVAWMKYEGYNSPSGVGIVLRGLVRGAGADRSLNEAELAHICQHEYIPDRILDGDRLRVKRFLAPTEAERSEAFRQTFKLGNPGQLKAYRSDRLEAVEITFVEFDGEFYWIRRVTRDTVLVRDRYHWEVTLTETDPCYQPPRRYFMERYRDRLYID